MGTPRTHAHAHAHACSRTAHVHAVLLQLHRFNTGGPVVIAGPVGEPGRPGEPGEPGEPGKQIARSRVHSALRRIDRLTRQLQRINRCVRTTVVPHATCACAAASASVPIITQTPCSRLACCAAPCARRLACARPCHCVRTTVHMRQACFGCEQRDESRNENSQGPIALSMIYCAAPEQICRPTDLGLWMSGARPVPPERMSIRAGPRTC